MLVQCDLLLFSSSFYPLSSLQTRLHHRLSQSVLVAVSFIFSCQEFSGEINVPSFVLWVQCVTLSYSPCFFTVDAGGTVRVKQESGNRSTGEPPTKRLKVEGPHTTTVSKPAISRSDWLLNLTSCQPHRVTSGQTGQWTYAVDHVFQSQVCPLYALICAYRR